MCITQPQLLRLLSGELPDHERLAIETHLADCAPCHQQFEEMRRTWEALDQWPLPGVPDLTARIMAAAAQPSPRSALPLLRIAAAILLACGVGIVAGLSVPSSQESPTLAQQVSTEEVVQALGLDALGSDTGLTDGVLEPVDAPLTPEESR